MPRERDPDVSKERKSPQTEKILRQFLSLESGNGNRRGFRENYDLALGKLEIVFLDEPMSCCDCSYVANSQEEVLWHEKQTPHRSWKNDPR